MTETAGKPVANVKMVNQYEEIRKRNIEDNRRILAELGILNPFKPLGKVVKKSVKRKRHSTGGEWVPKKQAVEVDEYYEGYGSIRGTCRRSSRIQGKAAPNAEELKDEVDRFVEEEQNSRLKVRPNRPNFYGAVEGVEVGTLWQTRMEACHAGIHRPTVAGIHGGEDGAYSIALSGGYEDDIDLGECFTYTGEGGRDLKGTKSNPKNLRTAAQSKDQTLTRGNLALSRNVESGNPVRVIRGYKLRSPFAPEDGYRYDGLYTVEKAWFTVGLSGFGVWKFALRRCENQALPPWNIVQDSQSADSAVSPKASPSGNKDKAAVVSSSSEDAEAELCSSEKTEKPIAVKVEETTEKTDGDSTAPNKCPTTPVDSTATETKSESDSGIDSDSGSVGSLHRSNSVISDGSTTSDNQSENKSDV